MPPGDRSFLNDERIDKVCESLRVNPSWAAAAEYAAIGNSTLRHWRERGEHYQRKIDGDDSVADLRGRQLYRDARTAWSTPGRFYEAQKLLERLSRRLEADPDRPYWEAAERFTEARSRGEMEIVASIRAIARNKGHKDQLKALERLLKIYGRPEYADRLALTGADGGALEVSAIGDAHARALAALEELEARRDEG